MTLVARTAGEPASLVGAIRQQVTAIDPELPFFAVKPMQQRVEESLVSRKTPMMLATLFGGDRAVSRGGWHLRRAGLPGGAAAQGNRHPHGARQRRPPDLRPDRLGRALAARPRHRRRPCAARSRSAARWRRSCSVFSRWIRSCSRSSRACSGRRLAGVRGSRAPRRADRSADRASGSVTHGANSIGPARSPVLRTPAAI